jgi:hypothetical protein
LSYTNVNDYDLGCLERLESLEEVDLTHCREITYQSLFFLSKIKNLKKLILYESRISLYGLKYFKNNRSIEQLNVRGCNDFKYYVNDELVDFARFTEFHNLRRLKVGERCSNFIVCKLSQLTELSLVCGELTQKLLDQLIDLNLRKLNIIYTSSEEDLKINDSTTLEELTLKRKT